jgi:putative membrane-bound dehydrogenase-like protein
MVMNPSDMDIDARGRVWCTEGVNYRVWQKWGKLRPEGDRIVILEDTNGDGLADKSTTFYQGNEINTALGICVLGDHVIVSCSPNVYLFTDANHDDKADGPPTLLFTGIKGTDHDHGVHAFVFGPDGKVYFNMGNEGQELHTPDGRFVVDRDGREVRGSGKPYRQGLAFRCNPDGTGVETVGWNFRNNYELCIDSFGTLWQSDNDDDGNRGVRINFLMEFGNYGYTDEMTGAGWSEGWKKAQSAGAPEEERPNYHWHQHDPGVVPNLLQTGNGSPTGIALYEGKLLPEVFRNQIIHCDAGPRVVRAYPVEADGAGYKARTVDLITTDDTWFRPSDVCVAPDGSLYVADWNDAGVGGHNMADQKLETMTGRVYRVAPAGNKPSVPKWDVSSPRSAVQALQSPNQATRYLAWQSLHAAGAKAESALRSLWDGKDARMRARALHLLARIPGRDARYVQEALKDSDPNIRITGLRTARSLGLDVIPSVRQVARDPSPQVRREAAIALRHSKSPAVPELWADLALQHDGRDRWYLEALGIAMDGQEEACFEAWLKRVGDQWNTPAGRDIIWRSRSRKAPALLVRIITDKATPRQERARYLRSLDFIKGPEREAALVDLITSGIN